MAIHEEDNKQSLISDADSSRERLLDVRDKAKRFDSLTQIQIWGYGVGHFINDLVAACWFNYLFFFLKHIVKTPAASAAVLAGQITDGVATPIVGVLSDRSKTRFGILFIKLQVKEHLGMYLDLFWWLLATFQYISHTIMKIKPTNTFTTPYFRAFSTLDGPLYKSATWV